MVKLLGSNAFEEVTSETILGSQKISVKFKFSISVLVFCAKQKEGRIRRLLCDQ
jgi:hypothetical protein